MSEPRLDRSGGTAGVAIIDQTLAFYPARRVRAGAPPFAPSKTTRIVALCVVVGFHLLLLAILHATGSLPPLLPAIVPARLILAPPRQAPPPPPIRPAFSAAPAPPVPVPDIRVAEPPPDRPAFPRAIARAPSADHPASHFGSATDSGLGLDVAIAGGGGRGSRDSLAGFEAGVRARVLAGKRQPVLAWDRRNTCVVAYRLTVSRSGALAGFSIDPCAVPEINAAAREAIAHAGPFPLPPDLGSPTTEVHGTLVFRP